ncbi:MAG: hypothetical protein JWM35_1296, partial [Verrucomicrobia bacterium]|nr:hypothetical protein [Verrucomicrobiota bacterium]
PVNDRRGAGGGHMTSGIRNVAGQGKPLAEETALNNNSVWLLYRRHPETRSKLLRFEWRYEMSDGAATPSSRLDSGGGKTFRATEASRPHWIARGSFTCATQPAEGLSGSQDEGIGRGFDDIPTLIPCHPRALLRASCSSNSGNAARIGDSARYSAAFAFAPRAQSPAYTCNSN